MRSTRFGAIAQGKTGYIWDVFDIVYGKSNDNTGSFRLSSSKRKMVSTEYTMDSIGFTLVDSSRLYPSSSWVGKFIVNVEDTTDTTISGEYLYQVTSAIQRSSSYTLEYERYSVTTTKGTTTGETVSSKNADAYPVNGALGNYWYVLRT